MPCTAPEVPRCLSPSRLCCGVAFLRCSWCPRLGGGEGMPAYSVTRSRLQPRQCCFLCSVTRWRCARSYLRCCSLGFTGTRCRGCLPGLLRAKRRHLAINVPRNAQGHALSQSPCSYCSGSGAGSKGCTYWARSLRSCALQMRCTGTGLRACPHGKLPRLLCPPHLSRSCS